MPEIPPKIVEALKTLEQLGSQVVASTKRGAEKAVNKVVELAEELEQAADHLTSKQPAKGIPATSTILDNIMESTLSTNLKSLKYPSTQIKDGHLFIKGDVSGEKISLKPSHTFEFAVKPAQEGKLPEITVLSGPGIEKPRRLRPEETRLVLGVVKKSQDAAHMSLAVLVTTFGLGTAFWGEYRHHQKVARQKAGGAGKPGPAGG